MYRLMGYLIFDFDLYYFIEFDLDFDSLKKYTLFVTFWEHLLCYFMSVYDMYGSWSPRKENNNKTKLNIVKQMGVKKQITHNLLYQITHFFSFSFYFLHILQILNTVNLFTQQGTACLPAHHMVVQHRMLCMVFHSVVATWNLMGCYRQ